MTYENHFKQEGIQGPPGPPGNPGKPGKDGTPGASTPQPEMTWQTVPIGNASITFRDGRQEDAPVVGNGTLISIGFASPGTPIYKLSANLPTDDPPTVENGGMNHTYYGFLSDDVAVEESSRCSRISDDGKCAYDFAFAEGEYGKPHLLRIDFNGGSGNGVFNTILS